MDMIENEIKRVTSVIVPPKDANPLLEQYNSTAVKTGIRLSDMINVQNLIMKNLHLSTITVRHFRTQFVNRLKLN